MKRSMRLIVIMVVISTLLSLAMGVLAAGETGTWIGLGPKSTITGTYEGAYKSAPAGTMKFQVAGGPLVGTFCTDLLHYVGTEYYASDEVMPCAVRWLLLHYPPRLNDTWTDRPGTTLRTSQEMAARQAVVWHFSDGFMPYTTTTVGARAWEIIEDVKAQADPCASDAPDIVLEASVTTAAVGDPVDFTVRVLQGNQPVVGRQVALETSLGTLSADAVTTDADGEATFTLTSVAAGSSQITATAQMSLPVGTIFVGVEPNKQKLVLGEQTEGAVVGKSTVAWVEDGTLVANVFNDLNMDGVLQDGEEGLSGWKLKLQGGSSQTTGEDGYVAWTLPAGTYTVMLTQESGYFATNPAMQTISLGQGEIASLNFGQIVPPVIKVKAFQDVDLDAAFSEGDAPLEDWMVGLFRADGSQAAGWNRATDADGWVYFSTGPSRDPADVRPGSYYVQETLPEGWYATGPISDTFSVASEEIYETAFGNIKPAPGVEVALSAGEGNLHLIHSGDRVTYRYSVTNTGNTYLDDVQVKDSVYGTICTLSGPLAPGEVESCDYTTTVADTLTTVATATGLPTLANGTELDGFAGASHTGRATVRVLRPGVKVSLNASAEAYAGASLTYAVMVENTGDADLVDLAYDSAVALSGCPSELAAGASASCSASRTLNREDVGSLTFSVAVTGEDLLGQEVSDTADVSTQVLLADSDGDTIPDLDEGTGDTDNDGKPDYLDTDSDGDGIPDATEGTVDTDSDGVPDYQDTDSDGDGISDDVEGTQDTDNDGTPDYRDTDSDGDGIPDATEGTVDTDNDGVSNYLDDDSDGDGISDDVEGTRDTDNDGTPDYRDADSDGDTIPDATEGTADTDNDGTPDYRDADSDGDGIPDTVEGAGDADKDGTPNYVDTDSDGDGIPDSDEGTGDADGDGVSNYLDTDSDGDGIPDTVEGPDDTDNDGVPNYLDDDSDGDGISDADEGTGDADGDGVPNYLDTDSDGDGIPDADEGMSDTNADGVPDYRNPDSDGDGIPDADEGTGDADGDGTPNYRDTDSDGDGIPDAVEGTDDADGDGLPNYLDDDSDGDGIPDDVEGTDNPDNDSLPAYLDTDSDGDGIPDADEGTGDADNDGLPNYLDPDSDGDGISDADEGTGDVDNDGLPNYLDTDSDGDGIPDADEGTGDADKDGVLNYRDTDSDGDGIPDADEGTGDVDGDGVPDYLDSDSDGDGIPDAVEGTDDMDNDGLPNYLDTDSDNDGTSDMTEGAKDSNRNGLPDYLDDTVGQNQDDKGGPIRLYLPLVTCQRA